MELDQLRYFLGVAEHGSFTRAADALLISQPALSRSIRRLEEELGQPVFDRGPRTVALTDAGELLQVRARQVLSLIDDTRAEIADDGRTGRVRVAAIPTIAPFLLPSALTRFAARFPDASLTVLEATTDRLITSLLQGETDVAIVALPIRERRLQTEPLFDEELLLVAPPEHPLATVGAVSLSDLEQHPLVLLDEAHCLSENVLTLCRDRSLQPVVIERTSQLATVQELVALGHGLSLIPAMARRCDESDRRTYRSFAAPQPTRTIAVAWNPQRFQSRLAIAFRESLGED